MNPATVVSWNGMLVPAGEAKIEIDDLGFLSGDGVYETVRVENGLPFFLAAHLERLYAGLDATGIGAPCPVPELHARLRVLLAARADLTGVARLRITVSSGPRRDVRTRGGQPSVLATVEAWAPPPREAYQRGVLVAISAHTRAPHPLHRIKTTSQAWSAWSRREAESSDVFDVLQCNVRGDLAEGTFTNVFVVDADGTFHTPAPDDGCLPGVTRAVVLDLARSLGFPCVEGGVSRHALATHTEVFLTSSLCGIVPVHHAGSTRIGDPGPGPRTRRVTDAYAARLEDERAAGADWSRER